MISHLKEREGKDLSLDELEAVAGGSRDWLQEGCAATVEPGSSCWGTDGGCMLINVDYSMKPCDQPCIYCGAKYTYEASFHTNMSGGINYNYRCRECKKSFYYNYQHGQWEEYPWG